MIKIKKEQLDFMDWEFGVFFHFGIRTFYEGHEDWDMKEMSAEAFNPKELDCEEWIKTAKTAGARYAIFVCKHHDGFANWPSEYTDYSVANTPWKNGKGDVVREFVDACRKYDMKIGLYYSPAQFGYADMKGDEYDDYFVNQISELLENYGKIDYLWFDGCGSENHKYDTDRLIKEIRKRQPHILIFTMWDPDTRWVQNESGIAPMPNKNVVDSMIAIMGEGEKKLDEKKFLPVECDCRIHLLKWFYSENDEQTLKSVDELLGLYYYSVGRGANLLINVAPDRRGLLPEKDAARLVEFGEKVKKMFGKSIAGLAETTKNGDVYTVDLKETTLINHVILEEEMSDGEKIESFEIYIYPYPYGEAIYVYSGKTVGHKHICRFPTVRTGKVEIVIKSKEEYKLKNIGVYYAENK